MHSSGGEVVISFDLTLVTKERRRRGKLTDPSEPNASNKLYNHLLQSRDLKWTRCVRYALKWGEVVSSLDMTLVTKEAR